MRSISLLTAALVTLLAGSLVNAAEHGDDAGLFQPEKLKWQDGPKSIPIGAKLAILEGDPTKDGPFVMRLRLPDGYKIPAHTHPKVERVTVISGTFNIVMGDDLDPKEASKMTAGSFGYWAAGMKHLVWADGETVVQLHGIRPWSINCVNPATIRATKSSLHILKPRSRDPGP
jgi:quercetin dioxygenase-like cupin family protein